MKELKEIRINETDILLQDNLVRGSILPEKIAELNRNIIFKGETVVEGPIFGHRIEVKAGPVDVQGATFAQTELYVNTDCRDKVTLRKSVASANSVVSRAAGCTLSFYSDINARQVTLTNAFVAGSIYADEVQLENCVVIGGVFATGQLELTHCMVGTFNAPTVMLSQEIYTLLPSAFSVEPAIITPGTTITNLSLADLGALYRGTPQNPASGRIAIDPTTDELRSHLTDGEVSKTLRSYTVIGKVLAADLIDTEKFQNHFLLSAAALGEQLLRSYDMGVDAHGKPVKLTMEAIRALLFDILDGRRHVQEIHGEFNLADMA